MSPPGAGTTEPRVEQISAESDTELSTTAKMRLLVAHFGYSRPQAHAVIRDYERGRAAREVEPCASEAEFASWVQVQCEAPFGLRRQRPARKWRVGEGGGLATR